MEVNEKVVLGAQTCAVLVEVDNFLVVPVHEIDLEALDAHL